MHNLSEVISPESLEKIVKKDKKALFAIQKEVNELKRIRYTHLRNIYWVLSFVGFFSILGMVLINNLEDLFYEFLVLIAAILLVAAGAKISIVNKKVITKKIALRKNMVCMLETSDRTNLTAIILVVCGIVLYIFLFLIPLILLVKIN